jgi:ADP-ribosylglycohydrolase
VAEGAGLENRYTRKGIVGSNPTLSVTSNVALAGLMSLSLADRLAGCLLGQAVGDAVGFVVEGAPPDETAHYINRSVRAGRVPERGREPFLFGQYSDDTQLARELLLVFREAGCFDPSRFAARVAELFQGGADVGAGPGTRAAAHHLRLGLPWEEAATPSPYAGNGAAMRAGPLGLLARDSDDLVQTAITSSRVTHGDYRCGAGAVAIAGAVALAGRPSPIERKEFLATLSPWVARADAALGGAVMGLARWGDLDPEAALVELHRQRLDPEADPEWRGITGHVGPSVLWSLYAFLRAPEDYGEAVWTAIAAGGDADTTGAMTGAMSGARLGPRALPANLVGRLNDRGEWGAEALTGLARDCAERVRQAN